ncbi:MAG: hypothetical protein AB1696_23620 [Planctomycetota bacterium]
MIPYLDMQVRDDFLASLTAEGRIDDGVVLIDGTVVGNMTMSDSDLQRIRIGGDIHGNIHLDGISSLQAGIYASQGVLYGDLTIDRLGVGVALKHVAEESAVTVTMDPAHGGRDGWVAGATVFGRVSINSPEESRWVNTAYGVVGRTAEIEINGTVGEFNAAVLAGTVSVTGRTGRLNVGEFESGGYYETEHMGGARLSWGYSQMRTGHGGDGLRVWRNMDGAVVSRTGNADYPNGLIYIWGGYGEFWSSGDTIHN